MALARTSLILGLLTFVTIGMIIGSLFQLAFIRRLEESSGSSHWENDKEASALRLGFVKPEVLSWSPRIILLHNFLSMEECDYLRAIARPRLQISTVVDTKTGKGIKSEVRTSSGMFLNSAERKFPVIKAIENRIAVFSQVPAENGELIQVLRYEANQYYKPHHDYFSDSFNLKRGGQRIATMLMYLSDDVEGGETHFPLMEHIEDSVQSLLKNIEAGQVVDDKDISTLKKRKLVTLQTWKGYSLRKGPKYAPERKKVETDLTREHLQRGDWKDLEFKDYNFDVEGEPSQLGYLQPLLQVRDEIQNTFLEMGFEEMPTNNFVESSFWNFDALFQPQQHPARDSHDTFFLKVPSTTRELPEDYLNKVKEVHEIGGYGSKGYRYKWKREEAEKNLLRTHTTAVSTRMLYQLAQKPFVPKKYFSIDRVFRNEAVDRTHLAEFHQIEGLICDRNLTLGHLLGVLEDFFARLGMAKLRFKPAYNPYTEPSMEIFSYHEGFQKWVEVGNSGMFRPEMLRTMGLPEDVSVIAWGLSLERPTMILYGINNIRDLFGTKVDFKVMKDNPICLIGLQ